MLKLSETTRLHKRSAYKRNILRFGSNEDGAVSILAIFLMLVMLMVCGIAVDLMQNEYTRTRVQNTLDRAILAASDIDQPLPADQVVDDYFAKAGMSSFLESVEILPGSEEDNTNFRKVRAYAKTETATPYMAMTGVDTLPVFAFGRAEEVLEKTEISLVIDISGSMRFNQKIERMRAGAKDFIAAVLQGNAANVTSLNIVPYAGQVNPGRVVFDRAGGIEFASFYTDEDGNNIPYGRILEDDEGNPLTDEEGTPIFQPYNQASSCLEIQPDDFANINLPSGGYAQTPYFMNWAIDAPTMDWGWCPWEQSSIRYAQNNIGELQQFIEDIRLHDGTGTHYGMKYGVALLNPSSNATFKRLNDLGVISDVFADRPSAFRADDSRKAIVLMTDGQITDQLRPRTVVDPLNGTSELANRSDDRVKPTKRATNLESFYAMCNKAKAENIQVYTIAFEAPAKAVEEMRNCATEPSFFYNVEGVEIRSAFKAIARQINRLRLTQ